MNKTLKFLQRAYKEWLDHVNSKRDEFPSLNYFQIDQIVLLRTLIADFIRNKRQNKDTDVQQLFDLIYDINSQTTLELLDNANSSAFNNDQEMFVAEKNDQPIEYVSDTTEQSDLRKELDDLGFSRLVIDQAFLLGTNDLDELIQYCMENL